MSQKSFEIGRVVYILSEEAQTILPGMVTEERIVKKLTGNSVFWTIKVGAGDKAKLFDSARIKGEVYGTLDEVKVVMTERLVKFIEDLTKAAELRVEKWYGKEIAEHAKASNATLPEDKPLEDPDDKLDPELLLSSIENPGGITSGPSSSQIPRLPTSGLREHLKQLASVPEGEEEGPPNSGEGSTFMMDIDGRRVPVRMPR